MYLVDVLVAAIKLIGLASTFELASEPTSDDPADTVTVLLVTKMAELY